MTKYGIDVSKHNGSINWNSVKDSGKVDFVILRAGYGKLVSQKDPRFEEYYSACKKLGIPVGAYWYSYATTPQESAVEASCFAEVVKGKQFEYPLYYDIEEKKQFNTGKENCTLMAAKFCEVIEGYGYWAGIYGSKSNLESYLTLQVRSRFSIWVAHYGVNRTTYSGDYAMWQKSESGSIPGISGKVDLDECYVDYPTIVKKCGLNGFPKEETKSEPTKKTIDITTTIDGVTYSGTLTEK